jgi:hypothetical protein
MKQFLICLIANALGGTPGIILFFHLESRQFLGIALIGGLIGFGLGMSSVVYKTTLWDTLRRVFKSLAHVLLSYNLGRLGRKLVPLDDETAAGQLIRGSPTSTETGKDLERARDRGGLVGAIIVGIIVFLLALVFPQRDQAESSEGMLAFIYAIAGAVAAYVHGAAISSLRVPGRHRRNILIGAGAGVVIGIGLGIATSETAKNPVMSWIFTMLLLFTIGVGGGTFASENLPSSKSAHRD